MILLITPADRGPECAKAIEETTTEATQVASTLRQAATLLRSQEYSAVIIDQFLLEAEPDEGEAVLQHMGTGIPVPMNFAICGVERVVRESRSALHRRNREVMIARQGAQKALRDELKDTVTALLLSCEMALQVPDLPAFAEGKMRTVDELAREMRKKLGAGV
jgi:hypothetical protein